MSRHVHLLYRKAEVALFREEANKSVARECRKAKSGVCYSLDMVDSKNQEGAGLHYLEEVHLA